MPQFIVLGEAPGRIEDREGKPFVGPAGQLLRKSLSTVKLNPNNGCYMNAVCCWPRGTPDQDHLSACRVNLADQLSVLSTRYVLVCGKVAFNALFPKAQFKYGLGVGIPVHNKIVYPVLHPAALLRSHRDAMVPWQDELSRFSALVRMGDKSFDLFNAEVIPCIYCGRLAPPFHCPRHRSSWNKDQKWNLAHHHQEELFDISPLPSKPA